MIQPNEDIYDVVIAGGGTAGAIAAVASARGGAKTLVIERWGHLGGTAVYGIPFLGIFDCNNNKVNAGIVDELVKRLQEEGGSIGYTIGAKWADNKHEFSLAPFEPETYKYVAQEMVLESGAEILFHTYIADVVMDHNIVKGIKVINKSGCYEIKAKVFIDCTGDADLAYRSGTFMQEKLSMQNVSMLFKMGNIDLERFTYALKNNQGVKGWGEWHTRVITGGKLNDSNPSTIHIAGHFSFKSGKEVTFTAVSLISGEVCINATRTIDINGANAYELSKAEILERRNVNKIVKMLIDEIPGFENSHLLQTSPVGIRESRNIIGEYILTKDDVVSGRMFNDKIAKGAYPIDIHDPKGGRTQFTFISGGGSYGIPYRCLVPKNIDGLLVAGRCLSATHESLGTARIMGAVMSQGEAAGTAAALAVKTSKLPRNIDIKKLRSLLRDNGAIID